MSGLFSRKIVATRTRRSRPSKATKPTTRRDAKNAASKELPCSKSLFVASPTPPSHCETMRDAQIDTQATGIQRAGDIRESRSRFKKYSVRLNKQQSDVAMAAGIYFILKRALQSRDEAVCDHVTLPLGQTPGRSSPARRLREFRQRWPYAICPPRLTLLSSNPRLPR